MRTSLKLLLCSAVILCFGSLASCSSKEQAARRRIVYLTNIDIPSNSMMVHHHRDETFVGRASQYTVFSFEEKPMDFLSENNFSDGKNDCFEIDYNRAMKSHFNERVGCSIPIEYQLNFDNEYLYLEIEGKGIYFTYCIENAILIVFITAT